MAFVHGRHALLAVLVHTVAAARGTSQDLAKFHVPTVLIAHEDLTNASSLIIHRRSVVGEVGKMPRKVWLEQGKGGCPKLHSVDYSHECRDCGGITYECLFAGVLSEGCTEETLRRCRECAHYEEVYIVDCGEYGPTDYPLYFPKSPVQEKLRKRGGKQVQIELRTFAPSVSGGSASSVRGLVVQPIDKAYADLMVKHKGSAFKSVKLLGKKTVDSNKAALWVQTVLSSLTREAKCPCVCDVVKDFSMGSSCVETVGLEVKEELSVAPRYCLPLASPVPYLMCCPTSASTWPDFRSSKFRPLKDHVTCLGPGDWTTLRDRRPGLDGGHEQAAGRAGARR